MSRTWPHHFVAAVLVTACLGSAVAAANFDAVKRDFKPSDTLILDRHGELLQRLRTDATVRRGQWVALGDVSPALRTALVLSEDKRFYEHSGVDWQAVSSAAWANLWNSKTRGASTITMQLAGLLDEDLQRGKNGRSLGQKISQAATATVLERNWRKDQILEAFLNLVPLKGELVGVDALSHTLFGKAAHGLDAREAALTAALVRAPNAGTPQVVQRACTVLKSLDPSRAAAGKASTDCEGLDLFASAALQRKSFEASEGIAPHAARQLIRTMAQPTAQSGTGSASPNAARLLSFRSSLSAPLQRFALQTLQQHLRELQGRHVEDAALVVLDNASGEVLAWVGSSGELSAAAEVDGVTALRQPGSTLKPFLYAQAIAERRITAASLLEDSSTQIQTAGGLYIPQNYDHHFKGWVSSRTALASSLNVPAVRTLVMVSPDAFQKQLARLGLPLKESGDFYGYSLALGSAEVSLLNLSNAYRTLANGGHYSQPTLSIAAPTAARASAVQAAAEGIKMSAPGSALAIDPRAAYIVGDILSDTNARARTFGSDSLLATRYWSAVKTGTSKDMRDNWALGYSQRYTVGVWVGNASGAPMWDVSGTTGAAPIWLALMNYLHKSVPSKAPLPPAGLVQAPVQFAAIDSQGRGSTPVEAARKEWFLQGTQQAAFALKSGAAGGAPTASADASRLGQQPARITSPTNGSIIALDPDIPPSHQRVTFTAEGQVRRWQMDGKTFAKGASAQWLPWPGRHVVQVIGARGEVLDEVRLEVRGAGVKLAQSSH